MALDYALTIAGTIPLQQILERAFPTGAERPGVEHQGKVWIAKDLFERHGFDMRWRNATNGYHSVDMNGQTWTWEPKEYTRVSFRLNKSFDRKRALATVQKVVSRLLASGTEDMALLFNGEVLLVLRMSGDLRRYGAAREWTL